MTTVEELRIYEGSQDLVDGWVLRKVAHLLVKDAVVFYARKRHVLEIIPEFFASLGVFAIIAALNIWWLPWQWFDDNTGVVIAACAGLTFLPWLYFAGEVLRWNREYLILTNYGLYHRHFDWDLDWKMDRVRWAPDSTVRVPISYKVSRIDVGVLELVTLNGIRTTPAVEYPHRLHSLIPVAGQFKEAREKQESEWRL